MRNNENWVNLQIITYFSISHNFSFTFDNKTTVFCIKEVNSFMVHLGKLKWQFHEMLVAMLTCKICLVGKLLPRAYLHSLHSVNIWNKFSEKAFFHRNPRKIGLICNFYTNLSFLDKMVIISFILGYLAVKGFNVFWNEC